MPNPIARKLELFKPFSKDERAALLRLATGRVRQLPARTDIIREGDAPQSIYLFISGWACRYKELPDGRRQITAFVLPGDTCDLSVFILGEIDYSVSSITPVTFAEVSREALEEVSLKHQHIMEALHRENQAASAMQREWTVNLGQRTAIERIAHLICEVLLRLHSVGLVCASTCEWPLTQIDLADATGMSTVHVSRTVTALKRLGLITQDGHQLTVTDLPELMRLAIFDSKYLHICQKATNDDAFIKVEPGYA